MLSEAKHPRILAEKEHAETLRVVYPERNEKDPSASPQDDSERAQGDGPLTLSLSSVTRHSFVPERPTKRVDKRGEYENQQKRICGNDGSHGGVAIGSKRRL